MPLILYATPLFAFALFLLALCWIGSAISDRNAAESSAATAVAIGMLLLMIWAINGATVMHEHMKSHEPPAVVVGQP